MFCIGPDETVRLRAAFGLARANPVPTDKAIGWRDVPSTVGED